MKTRITAMLLAVALVGPPALFIGGCDKEVAHEEHSKTNADGTMSKSETTTTEKPNGTMETTTDKKVDNTPK